MTKSNNITASKDAAFQTLVDWYNTALKSKVNHLVLAFGQNKGVPLKKNKFSTRCAITGKRPITLKDVEAIKDVTLRRKVTEFLLDSRPSNDTDVLAYIATFNWLPNDTFYTTQQYASLSSNSLVSRAAYIALQSFDEQYKLLEVKPEIAVEALATIATPAKRQAKVKNS